AAILRAYTVYRLPLLSAPLHVGRWALPGISPALRASLQSGWTELSSSASRAAAATFGTGVGPSGGVRTSLWLGVSTFGGFAHLGLTREVSRAKPWRVRFRIGG